MNQYTKAYNEGMDAWERHSDTCPYEPLDGRHDWWWDGWKARDAGYKKRHK